MPNPQTRTPPANPSVLGPRRPGAAPVPRFLRGARDPRWSAGESATARASLARRAALVRRQLVEQSTAGAARKSAPGAAHAVRRGRPYRRRILAWLLAPLLVLAVLALLGSALPVSSQTRNAPSRASIEEIHRLIEVAREAGLTDDQIRQITIEDEFGNVINAWDYLQELDKRKEVELARRQEELNRVYLTPQDILRELRELERQDLDQLRTRLPFDAERYR